MTLSDLEWPFHASRAISAVTAELIVLVLFCAYVLIFSNRRITNVIMMMMLCSVKMLIEPGQGR